MATRGLWGLAVLCLALGTVTVAAASSSRGSVSSYGKRGDKMPALARGVNGGTTCAVCTLLVSLAEQTAEIHNDTIVQGLERICSYLPDGFRTTCRGFLEVATPILLEMAFDELITADVACQLLNLCYTDPMQSTCHLFPLPSAGMERVVEKARNRLPPHYRSSKRVGIDIDCAELPILKEVCEVIKKRFGDNHQPVVDLDLDSFGVLKTLRGSYWRGKDCSDLIPDFHPGVKPIKKDEYLDSDCNGIYGIDPQTGTPFEDTLCGQTQHMGTILFGDSAGAHFHIPKEWLTATELSLDVFKDVAMIVENEIDWPMTSAVTGHLNSSWSVLKGPTDSLYLKLRELNRCNHRDFQNIGVNGADSINMNSTDQYGIARNQSLDHPALLIYSLIGNDVCNGDNDTIAHMTTPEEMKANFIDTLKFLDTRLPSGSHVIVTGMADGRVLYDTLHDRVHPIGEWRQNVKYPDIYNYLSCLQVSPCNGWMSANESLRNYTSERAANLSKALQQVAATHKAKNFDVHYVEFNFQAVVDMWHDMGGQTWQLIEPVDGFHPSQESMALSAKVLWKEIREQLGDEVIKSWTNPNNARIKSIFGSQGGY